jgi:hypothetical protein
MTNAATTTKAPSAGTKTAAPPKLAPPERLLMGPGPSNPDPRVLAAMGANPVGHLDPYFVELMDQTMGAIGYTQLQVATARFYEPGVTERVLMKDREMNLRVGFRFLNDLLGKFDHDTHLALLAYNRGPAKVTDILAQGGDPTNGYSDAVLKGYRAPSSGAAGWR